jgi:hypothetical protein
MAKPMSAFRSDRSALLVCSYATAWPPVGVIIAKKILTNAGKARPDTQKHRRFWITDRAS